jgi:hypothetical protein
MKCDERSEVDVCNVFCMVYLAVHGSIAILLSDMKYADYDDRGQEEQWRISEYPSTPLPQHIYQYYSRALCRLAVHHKNYNACLMRTLNLALCVLNTRIILAPN